MANIKVNVVESPLQTTRLQKLNSFRLVRLLPLISKKSARYHSPGKQDKLPTQMVEVSTVASRCMEVQQYTMVDEQASARILHHTILKVCGVATKITVSISK